LQIKARRAVARQVRRRRQQLDALTGHRALDQPRHRLKEARRHLDEALARAGDLLERRLAAAGDQLPGLYHRLGRALKTRAVGTAGRLEGLRPRLRVGLALRRVQWQQGPDSARLALDKSLTRQLERRREHLESLGARLARLETGRLREWALRLGFAELHAPDGRWLRRTHELPAAGSLRLVMQDGSRNVRLEAHDPSEE
jgi:exonuclease VII large subunit